MTSDRGKKSYDLILILLPLFIALSGPAFTSARAGQTIEFSGNRAFEDLKRLVSFGPRPSGSPALDQARAWMIGQLKQAGCVVEQDSFVGNTPIGNVPMVNLIVKIPGERQDVVMLAGHYDTKRFDKFRFVGANDGGSSAAELLEFGRALCRRKNPLTTWLVFFDGEEAVGQWSDTDGVYGSRHFVQKLTDAGDLGQIKSMILVDMIGDAKLDIRRDDNSTKWLTNIAFESARKLGYGKYFLNEDTGIVDDHIPFINAGVSAVDLIDVDYGPRNCPPFGCYWHTAQDTVDHCSAESLTIVGRVVMVTLADLAKNSHLN